MPTFTLAVDTFAPLPSPTLVPTATEIPPTPKPSVYVTAAKGNLYIRRGPGTRYDRIGVLMKGMSAEVIGQDQLSKWVQVNIPDGDGRTGWVSLLTPFHHLDGDLSQIPAFTFDEWPEPSYIKNCTEHDLLVLPNELYLYNLYTNNLYLNEVQIDPGVYQIQDLFVPGEPVYQTVDIREGQTIYITVDALENHHNCP